MSINKARWQSNASWPGASVAPLQTTNHIVARNLSLISVRLGFLSPISKFRARCSLSRVCSCSPGKLLSANWWVRTSCHFKILRTVILEGRFYNKLTLQLSVFLADWNEWNVIRIEHLISAGTRFLFSWFQIHGIIIVFSIQLFKFFKRKFVDRKGWIRLKPNNSLP